MFVFCRYSFSIKFWRLFGFFEAWWWLKVLVFAFLTWKNWWIYLFVVRYVISSYQYMVPVLLSRYFCHMILAHNQYVLYQYVCRFFTMPSLSVCALSVCWRKTAWLHIYECVLDYALVTSISVTFNESKFLHVEKVALCTSS